MVHFRSKLLLSGAMLLAGFIAPPLAGVGAASAQEATSTSAAAADPASTGEVTIYRDKMGVPHVFADTAPALFYGASYAIAHDRLAEAEIDAVHQHVGRHEQRRPPRREDGAVVAGADENTIRRRSSTSDPINELEFTSHFRAFVEISSPARSGESDFFA